MSLGNTIVEAVGQAIGEFIAYIIGKTFGFEAEKAQKIGEYVILAIIVLSIVVVTSKYS